MGRLRRRLVRHEKSWIKQRSGSYGKWAKQRGEDRESSAANPDVLPESTISRLWGDTDSAESKALRIVLNRLDQPTDFTLTPKQKMVFRLCIIEEKTLKAAGEELGISSPSVFQQKEAILKKVKAAFLVELENH